MTNDEIMMTVRSRDFRRFHNGLRVLVNIDRDDLEAMLSRTLTDAQWVKFRDNPWRWFIRASDADAAKVWQLIESRQPREEATERRLNDDCPYSEAEIERSQSRLRAILGPDADDNIEF